MTSDDIIARSAIYRQQVGKPLAVVSEAMLQSCGFYGLIRGNSVELLLCWIRQKFEMHSEDMLEAFTSSYQVELKTKSPIIPKIQAILARSINSTTTKESVVGGVINTQQHFSVRDIALAVELLLGLHPFARKLSKIIAKAGSANALELYDPKRILSLIDFPITSVQNLINALGHTYINSTEYLLDGFFVGVQGKAVCCYSGKNFRQLQIMSFTNFISYIDDFSMLPLPIPPVEALHRGIIIKELR